MANPPSLTEFLATYGTEEACWNRIRTARWGPNGFTCPRCHEAERWGFIRTRKTFQCNACKYQCSVTAGTILQDRKIPLTMWFLAAYLVLTSKRGLSTPDLARKLGTRWETAWFLQQKLMHAITECDARRLFGLVEVDEAVLDGFRRGKPGLGHQEQQVMGLVENRGTSGGDLHLQHIRNRRGDTLKPIVGTRVRLGSVVRTDGMNAYKSLQGYEHEDHPSWRDPSAHDELRWVHVVFSNLKRVVKGTHTWVSVKRLQAYLSLFTYRFNHRGDLGRGLEQGLDSWVRTGPRTWESLRVKNSEPGWV